MKQFLKSTFLIAALFFPLFLSAQDSPTINATVTAEIFTAHFDVNSLKYVEKNAKLMRRIHRGIPSSTRHDSADT